MSREAKVVTLGTRPPLALPEKPKQESRWEQRSEAAITTRGAFRADPSEGERITDFGVDTELQSDCGCLAGSFEKIAHAARPFAVGAEEVADCYSKEILEVLLQNLATPLEKRAVQIAHLPNEAALSNIQALHFHSSRHRSQLAKGQDWNLLLKTTPDRDAARNMRKPVCEFS
jgi:hypothetical protein